MMVNSFRELFIYLLSDIFFVEEQLVNDIPKFIKKADSEELKEALQKHLVETKMQVKRLVQVFTLLNERPVRVEWSGSIKNLFTEASRFLKDNPSSPLVDAALIAIAQRIEHFEIATYGTLCEFADCVGNDEIKSILGDTLKEEIKADNALTKLATGKWFRAGINEETIHNLQSVAK